MALEKGIRGFLHGINLLSWHKTSPTLSETDTLEELAEEAEKIIQRYKKLAMVEGAGTGFGGFVLSAVDFPLLISIKLKLLQELAHLFGYPIKSLEERIYILKVLQFQFSGKQFRWHIWLELKNWSNREAKYA